VLGLGALAVQAAVFGGRIDLGPVLTPAVGFPVWVLMWVAAFLALRALLAAIGAARLRAGRDVIARWHVSADDWDRFRAFDAARSVEAPGLASILAAPRATPAGGVEVIAGRRQVLVGAAYHALRPRGIPALRGVALHPMKDGPDCLEFAVVYPAGRFGGIVPRMLRVPVPRAARAEGDRVFDHFRALIPPPDPGIAYRRPRLAIGIGLAVALFSSAVALASHLWGGALFDPYDRLAVTLGGLVVGGAALLGAAIVAAAVLARR
jgi:hypothetical protein